MSSKLRWWEQRRVPAGAMIAALVCFASGAPGQSFSSGSTGADGDLIINTVGVTTFNLTPAAGGTVFHFKAINIGAGAILQISGQTYPTPIVFLAQNAVTIAGTIDVRGGDGQTYGASPSSRAPTTPGPGGYAGGVGAFGSNLAQPGNGPGGGLTAHFDQACQPATYTGTGGSYTGTNFLVPLIGGSGGGGQSNSAGAGGGGAILIASSVSISVTGGIDARGGAQAGNAGGGSGGAIRLVSNSIAGTGTLTTVGGGPSTCYPSQRGGNGIVRLEAFSNTFAGNIGGQSFLASPASLFLPASPTAIQVVSIGGIPVNSSPTGSFVVPDVTVNSSSPLTVQIQAQNVPLGTTVTLFIFSENGPDQTITSTALAGASAASSTATASVTLPSGFSRGYVKASWIQ